MKQTKHTTTGTAANFSAGAKDIEAIDSTSQNCNKERSRVKSKNTYVSLRSNIRIVLI